jgi:hypothetical protein
VYAAPAYYTEAPYYYDTEALKKHTTTYVAPSYYTYVPKITVRKRSLKKKRDRAQTAVSYLSIIGKYSYFYIDSCINLSFSKVVLMFKFIYFLFNYGVVLLLLLNFVSLMAGSTTDVPMSPWYGANQTATPPGSYTTYATTSSCTEVFKYYTTKAPEFYTTTYAGPSHSTDALKYYSAPSYYTTKATEYYMIIRMLSVLLHRGS